MATVRSSVAARWSPTHDEEWHAEQSHWLGSVDGTAGR